VKPLLPHFIQEQFRQGVFSGHFEAGTLFVDMSGFTALTESLMAKGASGAEQLSQALNDIFEPLVQLVYQHGGFIPHFAGDAFMAIFPDTDPETLVRTAVMARGLFEHREFRFSSTPISIKLGLSRGTVIWGIVGEQRKAYYFRGQPVDSSAEAQTLAGKMEIVADETISIPLGTEHYRWEHITSDKWQLLQCPAPAASGINKFRPAENPDPPIGQLFLPKEIIDDQQAGEFRTVISIFLSFTGVDSHAQLEAFANIVLQQTDNFSGYFKEIDFGDKGGVMVIFFGAPIAYENIVHRALSFYFALQTETSRFRQQTGMQFKAGITMGTAYTGIVGGQQRCQYAAVGNRVNLASRLMAYADWGEALVDQEIRKTRQYKFIHKGDVKYKGIKEPVPTFSLLGRNLEQQQHYTGQLVGRDAEMTRLIDFTIPLFTKNQLGIAVLTGEAGSGKSRLSYELKKSIGQTHLADWHTCSADQILRKPLNAFLYFLRNYFNQTQDGDPAENRRLFETAFQALLTELNRSNSAFARELERLKSILAGLLGLHYDHSLWAQLDAKGRFENTIQAFLHLLTVEATIQPFVLEIEDAHWLDEQSAGLLQQIIRRLRKLPIIVLITTRPADDGNIPTLLSGILEKGAQAPKLMIDLQPFDQAAVRTFAEQHLHGQISNELLHQLIKHTNSNPFYVEQILEYGIERNLILQRANTWTLKHEDIDLSGSIQAILTARIDRLSTLTRETVKAAAVIGREFELPVLRAVMNKQEGFMNANGNTRKLLQEQIKTAEHGQIWQALTEIRYIFKHSLLREAAYNMQLRSRRAQLHALIAQAIEQLHPSDIQERYADLAFHYEQAGVPDKTIEYLLKAADYARRNFQNQQALHFYNKLIQQLQPSGNKEIRIKAFIRKGKTLERIGQWEACRQSYNSALNIAQRAGLTPLVAQAANLLGQVLLLQGQYPKAKKSLLKAILLFEQVQDPLGMAHANSNLGNLYFRQGQYKHAKDYFILSIETASRAGTRHIRAQTVANLALAYMNQGDYHNAIAIIQNHIPIAQLASDKSGMAALYTNLGIIFIEKGDYLSARQSLNEGLALSEALGNKMLMAINIGSIGTVCERSGDYTQAMQYFIRDLELVEELGDKQGIAIALNLIGELLSYMGEFGQAIDYLQKSLLLCEELNYRKGLAKAANTLGDVFLHTAQYDRAIQQYDHAISITRQIDAKLILGTSLMEKAAVFVALRKAASVISITTEVLQLAKTLGNRELEFDGLLLLAQAARLNNDTHEARTQLHQLEALAQHQVQLAALAYEHYLLQPTDTHQAQALQHYTALYRQTPKFIFKRRIDELNINATID
jgi:predicted ATPase/class 3 adenylate cyclase